MSKGKAKGIVGTVVSIVVAVLALLLVIGLCMELFSSNKPSEWFKSKQSVTWEIGDIGDNGKDVTSTAKIRTRGYVETNGLKIELKDKAEITYKVFYYDADLNFISATDELTESLTVKAPDKAVFAKLTVTPTADEDGTIDEKELETYKAQLVIN